MSGEPAFALSGEGLMPAVPTTARFTRDESKTLAPVTADPMVGVINCLA